MSGIDWIIAAIFGLYSLWLLWHTYRVAEAYRPIGGVRWVPMAGAIAAVVGFILVFISVPALLVAGIVLLFAGFITYIVGGFLRRSARKRVA